MAERTGLEPATPGVTGRYSNQLNYRSIQLGERQPARRASTPMTQLKSGLVGVAGFEPATFGL